MSNNAIEVYLADDHIMVREGLGSLLAEDEEITIVGQCGDGLAVIDEVVELQPDVAIIDISMPGLNGLDICRELSRKVSGVAVLILTMYDDEQFIATALENGASGYLMKEAAGKHLTEAIHAVSQGNLYLGPGVPRGVLNHLGQRTEDLYETLTTRERQVLQMVAEGKTNRKIAKKLNLAPKTIDTHRTRLMHKLGIHGQVPLVKYAIRRGIIALK